MIDYSNEDIFPLSRGTARLRTRPSTATLWRWHSKGLRGVRLETVVIGGRRYTSTRVIDRFLVAINQNVSGATPREATTSRCREKNDAAARASHLF